MREDSQNSQWWNLTGPAQQLFHERAEAVRDATFGRRVFVRGVVEVSNYCRHPIYKHSAPTPAAISS